MTEKRQGGVMVHGGAGAGFAYQDGVDAAAQAAIAALGAGADALGAAIAAVVSMEGDGRLNAGSGANLGLDGATIELDACVMDSQGVLGAVAAVRNVKYPVRLARAIADSPHWLLCAEGAQRFADHLGHEKHPGASEQARERHRKLMQALFAASPASPLDSNEAFLRDWNFASPIPPAKRTCDTVGAVVRDEQGHFAVACSTGGSAPSLLGRIGDTPIIGSGFYAGKAGAVAATGIGEEIVRRMLASMVYRWIEEGRPLTEALQEAVAMFPKEVPVGLIAINADQQYSCSNSPMPVAGTGLK
ncbi:MAG: isoaspartyl peptidase/L-asparaginase [Pseudomonadota bacterium]